MARKKSTRNQVNQRAKQEYVGQDASATSRIGWRKRVVYIMRDMHTHPVQQRIVLHGLSQVEQQHGAPFLNGLTTTQFQELIRKVIWTAASEQNYQRNQQKARWDASVDRDAKSTDPSISHLYNSAATITHRVNITPGKEDTSTMSLFGDTFVPKGGHGAGDNLRLRLSHTRTQDLSMAELGNHDHPDVQRFHKALKVDKGVVLSADGKPFYFFGHISKNIHWTPNAGKGFNVLMPRDMDYRGHKRPFPKPAELYGYNWWTKWRTWFRTENMAKLTGNDGKPIVLDMDFDHAVLKMQHWAWGKAKSFYTVLHTYREAKKRKREIEDKYKHHSGIHTQFSSEDELEHRNLIRGIEGMERMFKGQSPRFGKNMDPEIKKSLIGTTSYLGDSLTWYIWLLACEHQFGILVPERKTAPENDDKPTTRNPVQPKLEHSVLQPVGREEVPRWDLDSLKGIGFTSAEFPKFEDELKKSNYHFTEQGNKAETHLWIPLVTDLELKGLKLLPGDISRYLSRATEQRKTDYLVGRENHELSVRRDLPIHQWKFVERGKSYSLIPAADYLKYFDSPIHGGSRFIHGEPFLMKPPPRLTSQPGERAHTQREKRASSYQFKRFVRSGVEPKYGFNPVGSPFDVTQLGKKVANNLQQKGITPQKQANIVYGRIAQRQGLAYPIPGEAVPGRNFVKRAKSPTFRRHFQPAFTQSRASKFKRPWVPTRTTTRRTYNRPMRVNLTRKR